MISQLSVRERVVLGAGGTILLAVLLWLGVVTPWRNALARLDARIASRQQQVREVEALHSDLRRLQQQLTEAEGRLAKGGSFSLFSFIETAVGQVATRENLVYMRPQPASTEGGVRTETVEIRLEKIRLDQLVRLLYAVDSAEALLSVTDLKLRTRFDNRAQLDAVLTISAYGRSA